MSGTKLWLGVLSVVVLAGCAPVSATVPRVDLRRVAAEVVATAEARASVVVEATAAAPVATATEAIVPTAIATVPAEPRTTTTPVGGPSPELAPTVTAVAPATPVPHPTATVEAAMPPTAVPLVGRLEPGGTFAQFGFDYPGDRSVFTVNLHVEPDDAGLLKNAGFVVYGPGAEEIVRGGAQPGRRPNMSADVIHTRPGRYLVQVQNYDPVRAIAYRIDLATGPPPPG